MSPKPIRRLIETSIPLEAINEASAREKNIRHGHPSTLHLWWSRKPLSTARIVLLASLLMDPADPDNKNLFHPDYPVPESCRKPTVETERDRLHDLIRRLVVWENSTNIDLLNEVRQEIHWHTGGNPPPVLDPFAGGGSIPLEAQRLGLPAFASDLNPVAVLINKALIEIPPRFAGRAPINPRDGQKALSTTWKGAAGLAADVRYYGEWMRDRARERIGHHYPTARTEDGKELTVIAWLWSRTVPCENPSCGCAVPLKSGFDLSKKKGKEMHLEPVVEWRDGRNTVRWTVQSGPSPRREGTVGRKGATCIACSTHLSLDYVRRQAQAGRMNAQLTAIVAEGPSGRVYLPPDELHEKVAQVPRPAWDPEVKFPIKHRNFQTPLYGMTRVSHLFSDRQLLALTTFSDLVHEAHAQVQADGGSAQYATAVATYLAFAVDKLADYNSSICSWHATRDGIRHTFARQAIPMVWDYAELNVFSQSTGNFMAQITWIEKVLKELPAEPCKLGHAYQHNAQDCHGLIQKIVADPAVSLPLSLQPANLLVASSDPPYYDNIGYADLSDFFYVWLRRCLLPHYPDLLAFAQTPKAEELIAAPHRHGGDKAKAKEFFERGLFETFACYSGHHDSHYPMTVYYAFKQQESDSDGEASTGWETMLSGLIGAGFQITGTWPMRTEMATRSVAMEANALASSIVLVCRPRPANAPTQTLMRFRSELRAVLPDALKVLVQGGIAPVDLPQSAIGPGMAIYSRYRQITDLEGNKIGIRQALKEINAVLDECLSGEELDLDSLSRWALDWFKQHDWQAGAFGDADNMARARNTSVEALERAAIVEAAKGKVKLRERTTLRNKKEKEQDVLGAVEAGSRRVESAWLACQLLAFALEEGGTKLAGQVWKQCDDPGRARELAYTLYNLSEKRGQSKEVRLYNNLIAEWADIEAQGRQAMHEEPKQPELFASR